MRHLLSIDRASYTVILDSCQLLAVVQMRVQSAAERQYVAELAHFGGETPVRFVIIP